MNENLQLATLGGGCFWCIEAIFDALLGVDLVVSGYAGGMVENPTYEMVCMGITGHAEVVQIVFNPDLISFDDLLRIFFTVHNPTTLNRQGADVGTQYRSVIFYHNEVQKLIAENILDEVEATKIYDKPIVTEVTPFDIFYKAEGYHQEYFENNPNQPYCSTVIDPKVRKFREKFIDRLKE